MGVQTKQRIKQLQIYATITFSENLPHKSQFDSINVHVFAMCIFLQLSLLFLLIHVAMLFLKTRENKARIKRIKHQKWLLKVVIQTCTFYEHACFLTSIKRKVLVGLHYNFCLASHGVAFTV